MTWTLGDKIPRSMLPELTEDELVAVVAGNQTYVGRVERVRAMTRGTWVYAIHKATIIRENGRITKHGNIPIWTIVDRQGRQEIYEFGGVLPEPTE